jgi:signal transduction histidine kinase
MKPARITLKMKIVMITVAFFILAVGVNTATSNYIYKRDYSEALIAKGVLVAQMLKVELVHLLSFETNWKDMDGFEEQCKEAVSKYNVCFASVVDTNGKIIFHNIEARHGQRIGDSQVLSALRRRGGVEQVVMDSGRKTYHIILPVTQRNEADNLLIIVGLPLKVIDEKSNRLVISAVWMALLSFTLITTVFFMMVSAWVTRPIENLIETIKIIRTNNNFDSRVKVRSDDEIGILGAAFNQLIDEINYSRAEILKQNQQLEQQVADRMIQLRQINESLKKDIIRRQLTEIELAKRAEKLAGSNAELKQFAYVTSHDLKEPLRMVSSYLQLLNRRYRAKLDQKAITYLETAVDGANRMHCLIDDILDLSRVGTNEFEFQPVECCQVVEQVVANLEVMINESGVRVFWDQLPEVYGDFSQLSRLFQNLMVNAIKFRGPIGPKIWVEARRLEGAWQLGVRDNGIGIESVYLERIFLIFQRLHTRSEYSGTGIGLAICKKIVERHGGDIWAESRPGVGSVFYFTIPDFEVGS